MLPVLGAAALNVGLLMHSPVHVATCAVQTPQIVSSNPDGGVEEMGAYAMHVTFADTRHRPLKRVVFQLNDGTRVADAGTFSHRVTIDHTILLTPTQAGSCRVVSATLADGNRWRRQHAQP